LSPEARPLDTSIVVAGQAGQGIQLISRTLGQVLVRSGYHVLVTQDVMSRIRGGHNFARIRVGDRPVAADADSNQLAVVLHPELLPLYPVETYKTVLADAEPGTAPVGVIGIPLKAMAMEHGSDPVMASAVALGAAVAIIGHKLGPVEALLHQGIRGKSADVVERNIQCARAGFEAIERSQAQCCGVRIPVRECGAPRLLISGAEALALGAIAAGARFVSGYPMSPGTPILEFCASLGTELGLVVEQTEDEVAAVNMALGASFAGKPSVVATAGGGFSLMVEGLSLAGMTETPVTIFLGMRPGPGTGMATRTAQADLLFAVYAGHGEFPRAVLAPADAAQAFEAGYRAVRMAEKYTTPAIVVFDQWLGDALWTIDEPQLARLESGPQVADAAWKDRPAYSYRRYEPAVGGVSPRILPGLANQLVYADSDEHNEEGHITELAEMRVRMVDKRNVKLAGIAAELPLPTAYPEPGADATILCFGSTRGIVREAVDRLIRRGRHVAMVHLGAVWPLPADAITGLVSGSKRLFTVEGNFGGQLAQLLAQECRLRVDASVCRYDGRQLAVGDVEAELERILTEGNA